MAKTLKLDVRVHNHGSVVLVEPMTKAAKAWIAEYVAADAQWFGPGLAVEPRYVAGLVGGMQADGLTVA